MLVADIHYGKTGVSAGQLHEVCLSLIADCVSRGVKHLDILGDLLDNKSMISYKTLGREICDFLQKAHEAGIQVNLLAGNHDFRAMDGPRLPSNLRHLQLHGARLIDEILIEGPILWLPWLFENETLDMTGIKVVLGHISLPDFKLTKNFKAPEGKGDPKTFGDAKVYLGDYHMAQKLGNIEYIGSLIHLDWNAANEPKHVLIVDDNYEPLEYISTLDRFPNLIMVDFDQLDPNLKLPEGCKVQVRNVNPLEAEIVQNSFLSAGAGAVDIQVKDLEAEPDDIDLSSAVTVDDAINELTGMYEASVAKALKEFHSEMSS